MMICYHVGTRRSKLKIMMICYQVVAKLVRDIGAWIRILEFKSLTLKINKQKIGSFFLYEERLDYPTLRVHLCEERTPWKEENCSDFSCYTLSPYLEWYIFLHGKEKKRNEWFFLIERFRLLMGGKVGYQIICSKVDLFPTCKMSST